MVNDPREPLQTCGICMERLCGHNEERRAKAQCLVPHCITKVIILSKELGSVKYIDRRTRGTRSLFISTRTPIYEKKNWPLKKETARSGLHKLRSRSLAMTKRVEIGGNTSDKSLPHHLQVLSLHAIAPRHPQSSLAHRCMVVHRDAHFLSPSSPPFPTCHVIPSSPLRSPRTSRTPKSQRHITNTLCGPETDTSTAVLVCATARPIVRYTTAQRAEG
jgi:hypothetical protein